MTLATGSTLISALIVLVLGLIACFAGYRLFISALGIYGFIIGAGIGVALANQLAPNNVVVLIIAAIILGLIGAVLIRFVYWLGVFLIGAIAGIVLANAIGAAFNVNVPLLLVIVAAVVVGILALTMQRLVVILATALSGAWAIVSGVVALITGRTISLTGAFTPPGVGQWQGLPLIALVAWLILFVLGAAMQFRTADVSSPTRRAAAA